MRRMVSIPMAPHGYSGFEERVFRDNVRQSLEDSVSWQSIFDPDTGALLYFGQPIAQKRGTDTAFSVSTATVTYLPLPTIEFTDPLLIDSGEFEAKYDMTVFVDAVLHRVGAGGSSVGLYTLHISKWNGSTYTDVMTSAMTFDRNESWQHRLSGAVALVAGDMLRMRLTHTDAGSLSFDLTKAWMTLRGQTLDPRILQS